MTTAVCDASVLFKLLVEEEDTDRAHALAASYELSAPELIVAEIGNALWAQVHNRVLGQDAAAELMEQFLNLPLDTRPLRPLLGRALAIADALGHPIYDCFYVALAESLGVPLVTADRRFVLAARRGGLRGVDIRTLDEFS
ncbi:MAG: type II toxin-antitoxin system VapC family toxin [Steroidobacteraceae bacterium]|jgi:predicted nucleic acid-binding protein